MNARNASNHSGWAILGGLLIAVGAVTLLASRTGFELGDLVGEHGWPLFVIVPGIVLFLVAFIPAPPAGLGFAIAGSIVTAIGLLLWYQELTDHYESWSYAWALAGPTAAGLGMVVYGLLTGTRRFVDVGIRLAAVFGVVFLAGAWFFETIFETGRAPFDLGDNWPVVLIVAGVILLAVNSIGRPAASRPAGEGPAGHAL
jgi:hypothetical protein